MDRASALAQLMTLTGGLVPTAGTTEADLVTVRDSLARSLLQHAVDPATAITALPATAAPTLSAAEQGELASSLDRAEAAEDVEPVPLVFRRSLPAPGIANPALTPAATAGMSSQVIGPFADDVGAWYWFDIVAPVQETAISRMPAAAPFLVLPLPPVTAPVPATLDVAAGSLWMSAQLLAPAAPAGSYAGFAISGGTLTFSAAPTLGVGGLQVAVGTTLTLTVSPQSQPGPVGGGEPGADAGAVVADLPDQVTFAFTAAGAQITALGNASLTVFGATVGLTWGTGAPVYQPALGELLVPLAPDKPVFAPASGLSDLFAASGSAPVEAGAWALPVATTPAAQLGSASGAGFLTLILGAGISAAWQGMTAQPAALGEAFISGAAGLVTVLGAVASPRQVQGEIGLWWSGAPGTSTRSSIDVTLPNGALIYYISVASYDGIEQVEAVTAGSSLVAHIDRPLAADGSRLGPSMAGTVAAYESISADSVLIVATALPTTGPTAPIAFALHNALLVTTPPAALLVAGNYTATPAELDSGGVAVMFQLGGLIPTLPDPYAANFMPDAQDSDVSAMFGITQAPAELLALVLWNPTAGTQLSFATSEPASDVVNVQELPATPAPEPTGSAGEQDLSWRDQLSQMLDDSIGGPAPALFMLDVSSQADQLGVGAAVTSPPATTATAEPGSASWSIAGLDLVAPCQDLRVFTAPAVQWEPVVTIQNPDVQPYPFPSPAGFLDDGGPTVMGAADVTLVPVAPVPLLDQVVIAYDGGAAAGVQFTLPFGMMAVATLPARVKIVSPFEGRPRLAEVQPAFPVEGMAGGRQISLTAPVTLAEFGAGAPLPGAAVQLRNLVDASGNPALDPRTPSPPGGTPLSVLGPDVDETFNATFAPGSGSAAVPVSRIDLSGYGASGFSDWTDPAVQPPGVVQAHFDMIVGRASREVVQVKSILYPWGAIVVRTITIDRQDDNEIYRYDSGWVAATPGSFDLAGITVHPGAVLGAFNIRQIADTSQTYTSSSGAELTGVYFDADIQIDGVTAGSSNGLVPSVGQFGFVQTAPAGTPLQPADLAELIASQGPLGGPVDCVVSVGGTAQTMRLTRVEVNNAPHPGASEPDEFAVAARGSVTLPQPGSWSVLARTDDVSEPTAIDPNLGVPLIRQGPAGASAGSSPWRLAEAADLWVPDSPSMDYCLLHATDSTRVLFPRPVIATGATAFTSDQAPAFADGFALMGATGIFPRQDSCLAFPTAAYSLQIGSAGVFTLTGLPSSFPPSIARRTLAASSAGTIGFEYGDGSGTPSQISVAITPSAWSFTVQPVNVRLDMTPFDALMRTVGDLNVTSAAGLGFHNAQLVLGSVLTPLQDLLSFLTELGMPSPLTVSISNAGWTETTKYKLQSGLAFSAPSSMLPQALNDALANTPLGSLTLSVSTGLSNTASTTSALLTSSSVWTYYLSLSGSVQVPVPAFPAVKAGGSLALGISINFPTGTVPQSESLSFSVGWIITVGSDLIPGLVMAEASTSFAFMLVVTIGASDSVGIGCALTISATASIPDTGNQKVDGLFKISFTAEASAVVTVSTPQSVQATFSVSVDVTVCWFLSVSFSESFQFTQALP
jgi:hypothetical protein